MVSSPSSQQQNRMTSLKVETNATSSTDPDEDDDYDDHDDDDESTHDGAARTTTTSSPLRRDFQHASDISFVTIRHVNIAQRSAFGTAGFSLPAEQRINRKSTNSNNILSPSPNYLRLLYRLQDHPVVRQTQFSPSTGPSADILYQQQQNTTGATATPASVATADSATVTPAAAAAATVTTSASSTTKSTTAATLLGRTDHTASSNTSSETLPFSSLRYPSITPPYPSMGHPPMSHGYTRLPHRADVGFAHPLEEQVQQKHEEVRHESTWAEAEGPRMAVHVGIQQTPACTDGNALSMLAPPLAATWSPSQGWRPRSMHDRPAGLQYCLASCISMHAPKATATTGTLTLYSLPPLYREKHTYQAQAAAAYHCRNLSNSASATAYGKLSEQVPFTLANNNKILFPYHPLDLLMESNHTTHNSTPHSLYIVVQFPQERLLGVTKFFGKSTTASAWPCGVMKDLNLYTTNAASGESQAAFTERLWQWVHQKYTSPATPPTPVGRARLFLSHVGTDLLQCLLAAPTTTTPTNRVLMDATGEQCVVAPKQQSTMPLKRSSLKRVATPPATPPDYVEALYMTQPIAYGNLLLLYPRRIRKPQKTSRSYAVRIRCLRGEFPCPCFPARVGSPREAVSTVWSSSSTWRDEIKVNLPTVLDGTYRLEFTLLSDTGVAGVATTIPLSSTTTTTQSRIVIPNGKHRVELASTDTTTDTTFSLHFETLVMSSLHTGDPAVASILDAIPWEKQSSCLPKTGESAKFNETFMANASPRTLVDYFGVLLYMHLAGLVESMSQQHSQMEDPLPVTIAFSLMELLRKVKTKLEATPTRSADRLVALFFKQHLDVFDEAIVCDRLNGALSSEQQNEDVPPEPMMELEDDDDYDGDTITEFEDEESVMSLSKSARFRNSTRSSRSQRKSETPFSRVAFGASKVDRMRAEAELQRDGTTQQFSPYFEDDETIATAPSFYSERKKQSDPRAILALDTSVDPRNNGIKTKRSKGSQNIDERLRSIGDTEFAKRVKTAASAMIAPCVAPTLSMLRQTTPNFGEVNDSDDKKKSRFGVVSNCLCSPGSDLDSSLAGEFKRSGHLESLFRGQIDPPVLESATGADGRRSLRSVYVYEPIMRMWIAAWEDFFRSTEHRGGVSTVSPAKSLAHTFPTLTAENPIATQPLAAFFDNTDFFLPLCLKSIAMRYQGLVSKRSVKTKVILDDAHHAMFGSFVEILAQGLVGRATQSSNETSNGYMDQALMTMDLVSDFLIGLSAMIHPEFLRSLIIRFLKVLQEVDITMQGGRTEHVMRSARCVMKLRLAFAERIASLPSFIALNYPPKYSGKRHDLGKTKVSWLSQYHEDTARTQSTNMDTADGFLPPSGWIGTIVLSELYTIGAQALKVVLNDSQIRKKVDTGAMEECFAGFEDIATRACASAYQLVIRKNAMDARFQSESAKYRVAAIFTMNVLEVSVNNFLLLSKLDVLHPVRSSWLLSVMYILQEAPEVLISHFISWCCSEKGTKQIPRFLKLLELCAETFDSPMTTGGSPFVVLPLNEKDVAPWLHQECFNVICAAANSVLEISSPFLSSRPEESKSMMKGISNLFLQILSSPQSAVTCSRVIGGALQTLESDVDLFVECLDSDLQHWARVLYSTMNSLSLSVRSIAVDFMVSLFGGLYSADGNIDGAMTVFSSVLPECVAREIAMYSVQGHLQDHEDVAKTIWPLRRSIADLEDSNPLDDDRVDPQLVPSIALFCRTNQAIIDGVLLEMELREEHQGVIPGKETKEFGQLGVFDADEESLFEAASFFKSEVAPLQRVRWFLALSKLQEKKNNCVEAAEALVLISLSICDAIPHVNHVWRPSRFEHWSQKKVPADESRSSHGVVAFFSAQYLEPETFLDISLNSIGANKLTQPTVSAMCSLLTRSTKEAVRLYLLEQGMEQLAYNRLETLLKILMKVIDEHESNINNAGIRTSQFSLRKRRAQEEASLRGVVGSISAEMTKLAERLLALVEEHEVPTNNPPVSMPKQYEPCYVIIRLYGDKPAEFLESTTIPSFVTWEKPCICRVSEVCARGKSGRDAAASFAMPLLRELQNICGGRDKVEMRTSENLLCKDGITYIDVLPVSMVDKDPFEVSIAALGSKRFFHKRDGVVVETTVANSFPCALSRQSSLMTTEITTMKPQGVSYHS